MAELRIQPKKSAPSPWLLVGLAVLLLAAAAYFYLRPDPTDPAAPAVATAPAALPADSLPPGSAAADARATPPSAPDSATAPGSAAAASLGFTQFGTDLVQLTDRDDLRDDATIREQRDNFTSATARLAEGDSHASLRPGLVAAANLLRAIQQKARPDLATQADELLRQASQLTGRNDTPAEQTQNSQYLTQANALLHALSQPASSAI